MKAGRNVSLRALRREITFPHTDVTDVSRLTSAALKRPTCNVLIVKGREVGGGGSKIDLQSLTRVLKGYLKVRELWRFS